MYQRLCHRISTTSSNFELLSTLTAAMGGDHQCPVCQATFTRPQHVARHMRSRMSIFPSPVWLHFVTGARPTPPPVLFLFQLTDSDPQTLEIVPTSVSIVETNLQGGKVF